MKGVKTTYVERNLRVGLHNGLFRVKSIKVTRRHTCP